MLKRPLLSLGAYVLMPCLWGVWPRHPARHGHGSWEVEVAQGERDTECWAMLLVLPPGWLGDLGFFLASTALAVSDGRMADGFSAW